MQFNDHKKGIVDHESWKRECPPKKGDLQWTDGRSAKELAKYMTQSFPAVPAEIEGVLQALVPGDSCFDWDGEYVTALPGKGEGRNHDAIMYNREVLVTIEAKADETLGRLIGEELEGASVNKLHRISALLDQLFEGGFKDYSDLRYQLLTASVGTLLEAKNKDVDTALLLVVVFKTNGNVEAEKLAANHQDVENFLKAVQAYDEKGMKVIPNNTDIKLYFKELVV